MSLRLFRLLRNGGLLLALGLGYAAWIHKTGLALPCPVFRLTGLLCPGCGITRMCLALLRLDFIGAWQANLGLMLILPILGILALRIMIRYIRFDTWMPTKPEGRCIWGLVAFMLLWAFWRNLT